LVEHEHQIVADVCRAGARFANASEADLAALRQSFGPVYASLERDPQTKMFIAHIEALKASTSAGAPLTIPTGCTGPAPGSPPTSDPIAGTWFTGRLSESEIVRAFLALGGSERGGHDFFAELGAGATRYVVLKVTLEEGHYELSDSGDGAPFRHQDSGTYEIAGDGTLTLSAGGCSSTLRYDVNSETLRLRMVKPWCDAYTPTVVAAFPFTRSG
jgi:hypothetical protein